MACPSDELAEQSQWYYGALASATTWSVDAAGNLELRDADGSLQVELRAGRVSRGIRSDDTTPGSGACAPASIDSGLRYDRQPVVSRRRAATSSHRRMRGELVQGQRASHRRASMRPRSRRSCCGAAASPPSRACSASSASPPPRGPRTASSRAGRQEHAPPSRPPSNRRRARRCRRGPPAARTPSACAVRPPPRRASASRARPLSGKGKTVGVQGLTESPDGTAGQFVAEKGGTAVDAQRAEEWRRPAHQGPHRADRALGQRVGLGGGLRVRHPRRRWPERGLAGAGDAPGAPSRRPRRSRVRPRCRGGAASWSASTRPWPSRPRSPGSSSTERGRRAARLGQLQLQQPAEAAR